MAENIYIIRHGLTESNRKKIYAGWSKEGLCQEGINAILEVGKKLKTFKIDKILSSPIKRAVQTARVINSYINKDIEIEDDLKEMKMGPWEGLSEDEVAEKFPDKWKIWNSKPSQLELEGRETLKELQLRALKVVKKNSNGSDNLKILAVSHVAIIRVLIIHFNNMSIDDYRVIDIPNGAVFLFDNKAQEKKISRIF